MALNPLETGQIRSWQTKTEPASWWQRNVTTSNLLKYGGLIGIGVGAGALTTSILRPTYATGTGNINTQNTGGGWMDSIMQMIMPLLMIGMMLPMMQGMFSGSSKKKDE